MKRKFLKNMKISIIFFKYIQRLKSWAKHARSKADAINFSKKESAL